MPPTPLAVVAVPVLKIDVGSFLPDRIEVCRSSRWTLLILAVIVLLLALIYAIARPMIAVTISLGLLVCCLIVIIRPRQRLRRCHLDVERNQHQPARRHLFHAFPQLGKLFGKRFLLEGFFQFAQLVALFIVSGLQFGAIGLLGAQVLAQLASPLSSALGGSSGVGESLRSCSPSITSRS